MSSRWAIRAVSRIAVGLALAWAALPAPTANAQSPTGPAKIITAAPAKKAEPVKSSGAQPAVDESDTADSKPEATEPVQAAAAVIAKPPAPAKRQDYHPAGCAPGKLCIVCVAGCPDHVGEIVSSRPQTIAE
ncbi:MAG: hypothetical protein JSS20_12620 [Proteobacteria bacterium]|nr:hypothetical protein [Pseudomonadota bacterium]